MNKKDTLYFIFTIYIFFLIGFISYEPLVISLFIVITYIFYRPNNIFHPNNIVFAFSFLYIVLPCSIYYIYEIYNIEYVLPWGKLYEWDKLKKLTYYNMLYMFVIPYFVFNYFIKNNCFELAYKYKINKNWIIGISIVLVLLIFIYIYRTGGISAWLFNYQYTYLVGREGNGVFNVLIILFGNILVFLLGLKISEFKFSIKKVIAVFFVIIFILFISYLQGFKSRFIFLTLVFSFLFLIRLELTHKKIFILGILFFTLISLGNYLRSDGFYDSFSKIIEYMMTYFNVYPLHDMVIKVNDLDLGQTMHHIFVKPLVMIGLLPADSDFDLSVMLTKIYYPEQWYEMKATQQWPLATELHLNYYGMLFGWIPLVVYCYIISFLYKRVLQGRLEFALIYLIEMIRIFSTFRGVLLPWILPLDLIFYIIIYFMTKRSISWKK